MSKKELIGKLEYLLEFIKTKNPINGEPFGMYGGGLCCITSSAFEDCDDEAFINVFLKEEICNPRYENYPVIYENANYGKMSSGYFFERKNWSIRIKWLEEVIKNLKEND